MHLQHPPRRSRSPAPACLGLDQQVLTRGGRKSIVAATDNQILQVLETRRKPCHRLSYKTWTPALLNSPSPSPRFVGSQNHHSAMSIYQSPKCTCGFAERDQGLLKGLAASDKCTAQRMKLYLKQCLLPPKQVLKAVRAGPDILAEGFHTTRRTPPRSWKTLPNLLRTAPTPPLEGALLAMLTHITASCQPHILHGPKANPIPGPSPCRQIWALPLRPSQTIAGA